MGGNGSAEYPSYKRPKTVSFIPSVHMDPRHPPSRHTDPHFSPTFSSFIQDPPGRHLSKLSYSLVPVTANSFSLTTLHQPFLADSRPAQPYVQDLIHFMAH